MFIRNNKRFNIYAQQTIDGVTYLNFLDPVLRAELGITELAEPVAPADYSDDTYFRNESDEAPYVTYTKRPEDQLVAIALAKAKAQRIVEVDSITIEVDGMVFDGDEAAQTRMARAITALNPTEETLWVLSDNTPTMVTREQLQAALRLAGAAQTAIWVRPYQ